MYIHTYIHILIHMYS